MNDEELKAMLIIDMPDNCYQCSCLQAEISYGTIRKHICGADYHKITELYKRNNCPLKPLPQIKEERLKYLHDIGASIRELQCYVIGHDDCIDEILGETEE